MGCLLWLLVGGAAAVALWYVFYGMSEFVIRFKNGTAQVLRGEVPRQFVDELEEFARDDGLGAFTIRGHRSQKLIVLRFSGDIGESHQQRFRNLWNVHCRKYRPKRR